jgi:hypothetical protein
MLWMQISQLTIYDSSLFLFFVPIPDPRLISLAIAMAAALDGSSRGTNTSSSSSGRCDGRFLFLCDDPPATDPLAFALYRSCLGGGAILVCSRVCGQTELQNEDSRLILKFSECGVQL